MGDVYRQAVLAGDARAIGATYADDGVELPPQSPLVRGRAAIEQRFQRMFEQVKVTRFTFTHLETTVKGDIAYDAGTYEQQLALSSGQSVNDVRKYVAVLKRVNGTWKGAYIIYNSDSPSSCGGHQ